jgi:prepilin-type N-terminal cleavage/methylation domain-containing protein
MKTNSPKKTAGKKSAANPATYPRAFTLIELLVVISIIAILAAFTLPIMKSLKRKEYINKTQAEMAQLETAIDSYKAAYGFYPPSNPNYPAYPGQAMFSPLYFELVGTTNNPATGDYQTLDDSASISTNPATVFNGFGVYGFVNCSKGSGEDASLAKNFLPDLKPLQFAINITNYYPATVPVALLLGSVGGPDLNYQPMGVSGVNPWRYACPGTNNPTSYDLWIQLSIAGTTNLVCNWTKQVQLNNAMP